MCTMSLCDGWDPRMRVVRLLAEVEKVSDPIVCVDGVA